MDTELGKLGFAASKRLLLVVGMMSGVAACLAAQDAPVFAALPDAPSFSQGQESSFRSASTSQDPDPDANLPDSSVPEQNSPQTPIAKEQPKRMLFIIPNYSAVSADANVPPLDARGKFKLMLDESVDYSTFISVGFLAGIAQAHNGVPQFGQGASGYAQYYWHSLANRTIENALTQYLLPVAFKQDPRYFTKGHGRFWNRTGYAISRLAVTRTDSGGSQANFSEIIGSGATSGIASLYYPAQDRTWTKVGQRWGEQLALDAAFNVVKEFWPDIRHSVLHKD